MSSFWLKAEDEAVSSSSSESEPASWESVSAAWACKPLR